MNTKLLNKLKRLIKKDCASYSLEWCGINNYCCLVDKNCLYFGDNEKSPRCKYFEQGVLPLDGQLETEYIAEYGDNNIEINIRAKKSNPQSRVKWSRCGECFKANSNRQKYCDTCKKLVMREQDRKRKEKSRIKSINIE